MIIEKSLNEWFTTEDLLKMGFKPSLICKSTDYPSYLELGRIKMFYMSFDHWQIIPPNIEFGSIEALNKRVRIYTFASLIKCIYEWYELKDYEHLNLPKVEE